MRGQILAAVSGLEAEVRCDPQLVRPLDATPAGISSAVAWHFLQAMLPELVAPAAHPALRDLSDAAEKLPAFIQYAHAGPGVPAA